jgi:hypothetical protein
VPNGVPKRRSTRIRSLAESPTKGISKGFRLRFRVEPDAEGDTGPSRSVLEEQRLHMVTVEPTSHLAHGRCQIAADPPDFDSMQHCRPIVVWDVARCFRDPTKLSLSVVKKD